MNIKKLIKIILIIPFLFFIVFIYLNFNQKKNLNHSTKFEDEEIIYNSNIILGVNYVSKDLKGNEYIITASQGEIDLADNNTIFLNDVIATIKLIDKNDVKITSDYGKYNIVNYDTIFSKNVIITYLDNKITSDYSDFSYKRNSLIISKDVIYTNFKNMLKADLIEIDIETKDTKISMFEQNKKVNVKSKD